MDGILDRTRRRATGTGRSVLPAEHVVTPIGSGDDGVRGVLVTSLNPQRPFDESYRRFVDLIATTIEHAVERCRLPQSDTTAPVLDSQSALL